MTELYENFTILLLACRLLAVLGTETSCKHGEYFDDAIGKCDVCRCMTSWDIPYECNEYCKGLSCEWGTYWDEAVGTCTGCGSYCDMFKLQIPESCKLFCSNTTSTTTSPPTTTAATTQAGTQVTIYVSVGAGVILIVIACIAYVVIFVRRKRVRREKLKRGIEETEQRNGRSEMTALNEGNPISLCNGVEEQHSLVNNPSNSFSPDMFNISGEINYLKQNFFKNTFK